MAHLPPKRKFVAALSANGHGDCTRTVTPLTRVPMNEADTCRRFVVPKLQAAGWDNEPHSIAEQCTITDGRIVPAGKGFVRKSPKRADYTRVISSGGNIGRGHLALNVPLRTHRERAHGEANPRRTAGEIRRARRRAV